MPQQLVIASFAAALSHAVNTEAGARPAPAATSAPQVSMTMAGYTRSPEETYRLPLALAYGVPFSLQIATWLVPSLKSGPYSTIAFASMLVTPFVVHAAHDNVQGGWTAELGILGSLLGGALAGATILVVSGQDVCKDCDDSVGEVGSQIILGGVLGAATGYLAWAIIDTALYAHVPQLSPSRSGRARNAGSTSPSIAVVPHCNADRSNALVTGFSMVLVGEF